MTPAEEAGISLGDTFIVTGVDNVHAGDLISFIEDDASTMPMFYNITKQQKIFCLISELERYYKTSPKVIEQLYKMCDPAVHKEMQICTLQELEIVLASALLVKLEKEGRFCGN